MYPKFYAAERLRNLTPMPPEMREGVILEYRLRLHGIPVLAHREHCLGPPVRFVDEQRRGPYRLWVHEHTFKEMDGGTGSPTASVTASPEEPW